MMRADTVFNNVLYIKLLLNETLSNIYSIIADEYTICYLQVILKKTFTDQVLKNSTKSRKKFCHKKQFENSVTSES